MSDKRSELLDLIDGARLWGPEQVRKYSDKAHEMINELATELEEAIGGNDE